METAWADLWVLGLEVFILLYLEKELMNSFFFPISDTRSVARWFQIRSSYVAPRKSVTFWRIEFIHIIWGKLGRRVLNKSLSGELYLYYTCNTKTYSLLHAKSVLSWFCRKIMLNVIVFMEYSASYTLIQEKSSPRFLYDRNHCCCMSENHHHHHQTK